MMDEVVVANSDAIRKLRREPLDIKAAKEPVEDGVKETSDNSNNKALSEVIKMQHVMNKTISKNVVDVKMLDKEIKGLLKGNITGKLYLIW